MSGKGRKLPLPASGGSQMVRYGVPEPRLHPVSEADAREVRRTDDPSSRAHRQEPVAARAGASQLAVRGRLPDRLDAFRGRRRSPVRRSLSARARFRRRPCRAGAERSPLYELTAAKRVCLEKCQVPLMFLLNHFRPGAAGAFRLGLIHGLYCLGCCRAPMLCCSSAA